MHAARPYRRCIRSSPSSAAKAAGEHTGGTAVAEAVCSSALASVSLAAVTPVLAERRRIRTQVQADNRGVVAQAANTQSLRHDLAAGSLHVYAAHGLGHRHVVARIPYAVRSYDYPHCSSFRNAQLLHKRVRNDAFAHVSVANCPAQRQSPGPNTQRAKPHLQEAVSVCAAAVGPPSRSVSELKFGAHLMCFARAAARLG